MPEDLRRDLLRSHIEPTVTENTSPWPAHVWNQAIAAYNSGWVPPERRYPVILGPKGGIIASAEQLREILELDKTPEVLTVTVAGKMYEEKAENDPTAERVQVCDVGEREWDILYYRAVLNKDLIWDMQLWFRGKLRSPLIVESILPKHEWGTKK